jgi:hypothetical protein
MTEEATGILTMHWDKKLAYVITPKSGPMRSMETLLDANHALSKDLPMAFLRLPHWYDAGKLVLAAAESGHEMDIEDATDKLLKAVEAEGWMTRGPRPQ